MKTQIAFVLLLLTLVTAVEAQAQVNHIYPPLETATINLGPGCRIHIDLPKGIDYKYYYKMPPMEGMGSHGGRLWFYLQKPLPNSGEWDFSLFCSYISYIDNHDFPEFDMVLWDDKTQKWIDAYQQNRLDPLFLPEAHFRTFQIKTRTAHGWLVTYDHFTGEEKFRGRNLSFCLYRNERVICNNGGTDAGSLYSIRRQPLADFTPYVLKIVESIEFLEDADAPPLSHNVVPVPVPGGW
jgi:hypothetical protein